MYKIREQETHEPYHSPDQKCRVVTNKIKTCFHNINIVQK